MLGEWRKCWGSGGVQGVGGCAEGVQKVLGGGERCCCSGGSALGVKEKLGVGQGAGGVEVEPARISWTIRKGGA